MSQVGHSLTVSTRFEKEALISLFAKIEQQGKMAAHTSGQVRILVFTRLNNQVSVTNALYTTFPIASFRESTNLYLSHSMRINRIKITTLSNILSLSVRSRILSYITRIKEDSYK